MPPVTLSTVVDLDKIKMKWKEQYVSEGLNHKTAATLSNGIYRGFVLTQNITNPRRVSVAVGTDTLHAAVYQSADGFSLTYFDVGASTFTLDLSDASLDNQETVIVLSITYTVGADTTANWIAYPIADWNALAAAQRAEKIVLGSINVPAPATNITTSMINMKRRSWAWENSTGDLVWSPLLKNGSFEHAELDATTAYSASYWRFGNFGEAVAKVQDIGALTGNNCLVVDHTVTGLLSTEAEQHIGVPVTPGQFVKYRFNLQRLNTAVSGDPLVITLRYVGPDMITEIDTNITVAFNAIDAGYVEYDDTVAVPAGAAFLVSVLINYTLDMASTGLALRLDDIQVWLQTTGTAAAVSEQRVQQFTHTGAVVLEDNDDPFVNFFGEAIMLRNKATELLIERRDQNRTTGGAVMISPQTAIFQKIGQDLLNSESRAILPRFSVPVSTAAGVEFTLMWESVPLGQVGYRKYISSTGAMIDTVNAKWGGATWTKDVNGTIAVKATISALEGRRDVRLAANNTAWTDGSWDSTAFQQSWGSQTAQFIASMQIFGDLTMNNGNHVAVGGTGRFKHGTRTKRIAATLGQFRSSSDAGVTWFSDGSGLIEPTSGISGFTYDIPITLEVGKRILAIRYRVKDNATGPTRWSCGTNFFSGFNTSGGSIGSGTVLSSGSGTDQIIAQTGLGSGVIVVDNTAYVSSFNVFVGVTGPMFIYCVEVDYDEP